MGTCGSGRPWRRPLPRSPSSDAGTTRSSICSTLFRRDCKHSDARSFAQVHYAQTRRAANQLRQLRDAFRARFDEAQPKAVEALERDWNRMVTFFAFPKEHWKHQRTTNPVEFPFAAVRLRIGAAKRHKKVVNATALIWKVRMQVERIYS